MKRNTDKQMRYLRVRVLLGCMVVAMTCALWGCADPNAAMRRKPVLTVEEATNMPLEADIRQVAAYYQSVNPWIYTDDRSRVRGIAVSSLYLAGPDQLGVFGDGIIRPRLYALDGDQASPQKPKLIKEWSYDPQQALPFRSRKRTMLGYGYRFHLLWDELDLAGRNIRITVVFERTDGMLVHSGSKEFRVPDGR